MIADSTLLVDLVRKRPQAREFVARCEREGAVVWVPTPAIFELWEGIERSDRPQEELRRVQELLAGYTVLPFTQQHAMRAGQVSGELIRRGNMIGAVDAEIAGMALAEGASVITRNRKDFDRIPGLKVVAY